MTFHEISAKAEKFLHEASIHSKDRWSPNEAIERLEAGVSFCESQEHGMLVSQYSSMLKSLLEIHNRLALNGISVEENNQKASYYSEKLSRL